MYEFTYHKAENIADATGRLAGNADAKLLAGGQTLIAAMKLRLAAPPELVDLAGVAELKGICMDGDNVVIGAMTRHAEVAASNDVAQIKSWWKKWPNANIGFWLEGSGLAALDIDVADGKAGDKTLRELLGNHPIPQTLVCETPSGGKHLYYRDRDGLPPLRDHRLDRGSERRARVRTRRPRHSHAEPTIVRSRGLGPKRQRHR